MHAQIAAWGLVMAIYASLIVGPLFILWPRR